MEKIVDRESARVWQEKYDNKAPKAGDKAPDFEAEAVGLDAVFRSAGFEWREPGCSMCLAMNPDKLLPGERCASTSNRNFEGRQGPGGRTHLVSPEMAAAAARIISFAASRQT